MGTAAEKPVVRLPWEKRRLGGGRRHSKRFNFLTKEWVQSCPGQRCSQSQDGKRPACLSLLNMDDVSQNMTKMPKNYTSEWPAPMCNNQDRTTSHRPL